MTKKILLSVAASALLSTAAFAGTISVGSYYPQVSQESFEQNGLDEMNFGNFRYTFDTTRDSASISDPLVTIDVTDLEFQFDTAVDFNVDGKGRKPLSLASEDATITALENLFTGSVLVDVATNTAVGLNFQEVNIENGRVTIDYDGDASNELKKGHVYKIVKTDGTPIDVPYKFDDANSPEDLTLVAYSQTLDNNKVDDAKGGAVQTLVPQFKVSCIRKFDGLINFENDRVSFVNPEHGERAAADDGTTGTDTMVVSDRMIFSINNARNNDNNQTRWMAGNKTEFSFTMDNSDNTFAAGDLVVEAFSAAKANDVDTKNAGDVTAPTVTLVGNTFVMTTADEAFAPGLTTFEAQLTPSSFPIRPVHFINATTNLEQGLTSDEVTSSIAITADANGDYVLNTVDNHTVGKNVINPAIDYDANATAGEWKDHAYIAQIAGATQNPGVVESKFFIVNRSCAPATPTFKLIQDGKVRVVQGTTIAPDTQVKVKMADLVAQTDLTGTQFAVEIILPGVAEDFYIYAQSLTSAGATKDLPVYNTSARD